MNFLIRALAFFVLGAVWFTPSVACAEVFKVGLSEAPPLMFEKSNRLLGIYKELFIEISKISTDTFEFEYAPAARIMSWFNQGKVDIEPGINPIWRRDEKVPGLYSIPFAKSSVVMVTIKKNEKAGKPNKASGQAAEKAAVLKTGAIGGYRYPDLEGKFEKKEWSRVNAKNEEDLLLLLGNKKVDQAIVQNLVAGFLLKSGSVPRASQYVLSEPIETHDIMLRVHPSKASVIPRLNQALKILVDNGTVEKIYGRYALDEPKTVPVRGKP